MRDWTGPFSRLDCFMTRNMRMFVTFSDILRDSLRQIQWNQPSIDFYEKRLGAKPMSEWMGMRLEEEGIDSLKNFL